ADEGHSCRRDCSLIRLQGLRSHLVGAEYLGDSFNNSLQAMEDLVIGDSDHPQPKALEPGFPALITGPSVGMAVAVNLQDQTRGKTVEVHDVRSDHHLPRKLPTRQATVAESVPRLAAPARSCRGAVVEHDGSTRDRPIVVCPTCSKLTHIIAIRLRPSFNLNPHPAFGHPLPAGEGQNPFSRREKVPRSGG